MFVVKRFYFKHIHKRVRLFYVPFIIIGKKLQVLYRFVTCQVSAKEATDEIEGAKYERHDTLEVSEEDMK